MSSYLEVWKKYAVFSGRARRKEYWIFWLFNMIISAVLSFIDSFAGTIVLDFLYALMVLSPSIAVAVRRLHDTNRSGWWLLLGLIPIIGGIVLLVFFCQDSNPGDNIYGPTPKAITSISA